VLVVSFVLVKSGQKGTTTCIKCEKNERFTGSDISNIMRKKFPRRTQLRKWLRDIERIV
jgi:hypothetical protein